MNETWDVTVVGLGLIGGSFALAAARAGHRVCGVDLHPPADASFPVSTTFTPPTGDGAKLVLLALPPVAVVPWIEAHAADFTPGTLVVDATGVKSVICTPLEKYAFQNRWTFIGGHPMAGKETSGFASATPDLFRNASMILTPFPSCGRGPLDRLTQFFAGLGFGRTVLTTPAHHDRMIALTSQLAHVVSSAYVQDPLAQEHRGYSAGSFHDMTRVACLDPDIWTDLFRANRSALLETLDGLITRLTTYRDALAADDTTRLHDLLTRGREARQTATTHMS